MTIKVNKVTFVIKIVQDKRDLGYDYVVYIWNDKHKDNILFTGWEPSPITMWGVKRKVIKKIKRRNKIEREGPKKKTYKVVL